MATRTHQASATVMTTLMSLLKRLHAFVNPKENKKQSTPQQRRIVHGDAEEEFSYPTTRCLSSYYSIFVARLAIMVMLAILIGMLSMLTWHLTKIYTAKSINSLAYGLRYELLQRPILRMWNILNSTVEITVAQVKLSEYVIGHYDKPEHQEQQAELYEAMRDVTWALFASRKALNAVTISYRNGFVQAFHRDRRNNITYYIYSEHVNSSVGAVWYKEPLDPITGKKKGEPRQIAPDDLINIAGLSEVRDGVASWHVAVSKFSDSPLLSAALPVRHPSGGTIVAAVGVTTALKSVGQLMRKLVEFHSGYMYLTSRDGYLLATSTDAPLLRNTTTGLKLMMANDSEDPMIRSGAEWLQQHYGDKFPISHEVHAANVMLGEQRYYIDSFFLNLKRLPLVGVIIIPRKYIMGKVDHIGSTILVILISASICTLAIGCVCILILTSGVSKAMKLRAELINHLDARRRAEASSNYKSQFLANMSHELRTPMAAVIGLLDILIYDDCLTDEQLSTVTQIRKCSTALLGLLNNILDLSKVESGKLVLEEAEFDLGQELEGLVDMFSVQCMNHNVETILDLSDGMPKIVRGDSARVVQIFTNLISNSIKFTSEGYIILRGWCESFKSSTTTMQPDDIGMQPCVLNEKGYGKKNDHVTLWFEVEDTGSGIDRSKWETVFESFEQADPSTTRTHGGTGLGLCIVRNLVNKMGGDIKVVKKDGPGTLMRLSLILGMCEGGQHFPTALGKHDLKVLLALSGSKCKLITSQWLRRNGIFTWEASEWNGLTQILQQVYQSKVISESSSMECTTSEPFGSSQMGAVAKKTKKNLSNSNIVIVVDVGLLDQSTNIWKEQISFLDQYREKANFAWILNHDTCNTIKVELHRRGHVLSINKPLYKTKMIQILEAVVRQNQKVMSSEKLAMAEDLFECNEVDPIQFDAFSSDDTAISDNENLDSRSPTKEKVGVRIPVSNTPHYCASARVSNDAILQNHKNILVVENFPNMSKNSIIVDENGNRKNVLEEAMKQGMITTVGENSQDPQPQLAVSSLANSSNVFFEFEQQEPQSHTKLTLCDREDPQQGLTERRNATAAEGNLAIAKMETHVTKSIKEDASISSEQSNYKDSHYTHNQQDYVTSCKMVSSQSSLGGLLILLAEDNPILQRVATTMLEKLGARVVAVADGKQAVDALKCKLCADEDRGQSSAQQETEIRIPKQSQANQLYDLILMDCQMPKLDGYEATKTIRKLEEGTGSHIPIVAVTAHAMSSDEAKCLEVGMDAYLTKPIDCKLMASTILSLTKRHG